METRVYTLDIGTKRVAIKVTGISNYDVEIVGSPGEEPYKTTSNELNANDTFFTSSTGHIFVKVNAEKDDSIDVYWVNDQDNTDVYVVKEYTVEQTIEPTLEGSADETPIDVSNINGRVLKDIAQDHNNVNVQPIVEDFLRIMVTASLNGLYSASTVRETTESETMVIINELKKLDIYSSKKALDHTWNFSWKYA